MVFGDCFAIDILSLTGQNLGYSQALEDAPQLQPFLKKKPLKPEIQNTFPQKSKEGFLANL